MKFKVITYLIVLVALGGFCGSALMQSDEHDRVTIEESEIEKLTDELSENEHLDLWRNFQSGGFYKTLYNIHFHKAIHLIEVHRYQNRLGTTIPKYIVLCRLKLCVLVA